MSLDGYIAFDDDSVGPLFDWYDAGDVAVSTASPRVSFRLNAASAAHWERSTSGIGALVVGRTLFDVTDGWAGRHPLGVPVVVLTHTPPVDWHYPGEEDFHFVTDGIGAAIELARTLAGEKDVSVAAGTIASQALDAGLLDIVTVDLAPVVLRSGKPYFTPGSAGFTRLGDPTTVIASDRVLHLIFPVGHG
jgi:dihydrofolate reductase